jgi:hypothetical protein
VAISAMFYEVLHFRHVWALFGLIAALELTGRRRRIEPVANRLSVRDAVAENRPWRR